jgi:glycosyltransferase involved in cell wall biosynthesis
MKIWMITPNDPREKSRFQGGVETFSSELQTRLAPKHDVTFVFGGEGRSEIAKSIALGFKVRKRLKTERPDLLISNGILGWSFSSLEISRINIFHGTYEGIRRSVKGSFLGSLHKKFVLKKLEVLSGKNALKIAVSNKVAEELTSYYGFLRSEIRVVEGGVDTNRFSPVASKEEKKRLRKKYGLPADQIVCAFTASFTYRKGWDIIQRLSKRFENFSFLCTSQNFLSDNILGLDVSYSQMPEIYQVSDICLFPSRYDGFGLGLIEAMSCGLPFVAFPSGFCQDLKENSSFTECIVEDERFFSQQFDTMANDERLRLEIGRKCRLFAEKHDWSVVAEKMNQAILQSRG